jgi:malate permease and related proteins
MSIGIILTKIITILILTLFGVIARKFNIVEEKAENSLASIVINITVPVLIFYSISSNNNLNKILQGTTIPIICILLSSFIMLIAFFITKLININNNNVGTSIVLSSMPNSAFLGFPIIYSIFGQEGLTYAVFFDIGIIFIFFSLAVNILNSKCDIKFNWRVFLNPPLGAFIIGILLKVLHINISGVFMDSLKIMGSATIPLAMLLMGINLSKIKIHKRNILKKEIFMISGIKLLIFPLIAYLVLLIVDIHPLIKSVVILQSAMPCMASTPILVEKYGGNKNLATTTILITTILSIITIPVVFYFLI